MFVRDTKWMLEHGDKVDVGPGDKVDVGQGDKVAVGQIGC